jgi:hypothetical protein
LRNPVIRLAPYELHMLYGNFLTVRVREHLEFNQRNPVIRFAPYELHMLYGNFLAVGVREYLEFNQPALLFLR